MTLREETLDPGELVFLDPYVSSVRGWWRESKRRERQQDNYNGGTLLYDSSSTYILTNHQESIRMGIYTTWGNKLEKNMNQLESKFRAIEQTI